MGLFDRLFDFVNPSRRAKKQQETAKLNQRLAAVARERGTLAEKRQAIQAAKQTSTTNRRLGGVISERERLEEAAKARAEEAKQRQLESNPLYRYLYKGEVITGFRSSNVRAFWYDIEQKLLYIQFKDQSTYEYGARMRGVSPEFAMSLYRAKSKGSWVWDNLRVRGTKLGARVDYVLVVGPTGPKRWNPVGGRLWEQTPERAKAHSEEVTSQSGHDSPDEGIFAFARKHPLQNVGRGRRNRGSGGLAVDPQQDDVMEVRGKNIVERSARAVKDSTTGKYRLPKRPGRRPAP